MSVPEKHRAVAHAWADGADIEYQVPNGTEWVRTQSPTFYEDIQYRVAPKKVKKWRWVVRSNHSPEYAETSVHHYENPEEYLSGDYYLAIKLDWTEREVEE